ncbi:hypothetical protein [Brachyspira pilosicoli]|uniref:hypothetical protein n=1 Tax=Brachyspira pilosicoli TaxID=52584 RepID=UPI001E56BED7|nr:hypothetical protein [Brachyspira pilosicoli]
MSKKLLNLISVLFLISVLAISCSNVDKTGSGDNNSGNGGSGTGGDGGTTPTPEGIAKYAGTWIAQFGLNKSYNVIIGSDGSVKIKDEAGETKAENIQGSGNKYTMSVQHGANVIANVTITFNNDNSGNIDDESIGEGTISKIINE